MHGLKLITFDADGTLYADGAHMDHDNEMINHILMLLHNKVILSYCVACAVQQPHSLSISLLLNL